MGTVNIQKKKPLTMRRDWVTRWQNTTMNIQKAAKKAERKAPYFI